MAARDAMIGHDTAALITRALHVEGGHLFIGHNGNTLNYAEGATLRGYDDGAMKIACIAAGVTVIDTRAISFDALCAIVIRGPMTAVGRTPCPPPWRPLSYAPLSHIVALYRAAGAEIIHPPPDLHDATSPSTGPCTGGPR